MQFQIAICSRSLLKSRVLRSLRVQPCACSPLTSHNRIYKALLVNDVLADITSIPVQPTPLPANASKYNLSPAILRVCRQVHEEAIEILFLDNTFIFDLQNSLAWSTPLNRRVTPNDHSHPNSYSFTFARGCREFGINPLFKRLRHVKVLVGTDCPYEDVQPLASQVYEFCKLLQTIESQVQSLQVIVVPYNGDRNHVAFGPALQFPSLRSILRPFRGMRLSKGFELIEGTEDMCTTDLTILAPPGVPPPSGYKKHTSFKKLKSELETLVSSVTPISKLPKMLDNLMRYAQAFERNPKFREEMRPGYDEVFQRITLLRADLQMHPIAHVQQNPQTDTEILESREFLKRGSYSMNQGQTGHPGHNTLFKSHITHPLELALEQASFFSERNKVEMFKEARRSVTEIKEPMYQRILAGARTFNDTVKEAKRRANVLDPFVQHLSSQSSAKSNADRARLCLVAENYAGCFTRDVPVSMSLIFRLQRDMFNLQYSQLPRELLLRKMDEQLKVQAPLTEIIKTFKSVADDMDKQYLEIREARKALFDEDGDEDYGVEMDLERNRCDEMVKWNVVEPDFGVKEFVAPPVPVPAAPVGNPFPMPVGVPIPIPMPILQNIFNTIVAGNVGVQAPAPPPPAAPAAPTGGSSTLR